MEAEKNYKWMERRKIAHLLRMNWDTMLSEVVISGGSPKEYRTEGGFFAVVKNEKTYSAAFFDDCENDFVWSRCAIADLDLVQISNGGNKSKYLESFAYRNDDEGVFRLWKLGEDLSDVIGERIFSNFYYKFANGKIKLTGFFSDYPQDGFQTYDYVGLIYTKDFIAALGEEGYYEVYNAKGYQSVALHRDLNLSGAVQLRIRDGQMVKTDLAATMMSLKRAEVVETCYVVV